MNTIRIQYDFIGGKETLMHGLYNATVNNENFNVRGWCSWDAERFENMAKLIRRELKKLNDAHEFERRGEK